MGKSKSIEPTEMKDNTFMNLVGLVIATGIMVLFLPLLPIIIVGYIYLKIKPQNK